MLALHLSPEIERRLDALAKKTGRSKSDCACEAILRQIEDIEDYYLARRRLEPGGPRLTLESLERDLKKRTKPFR
jgi:RHH-type transcriptional regulator, rel operon repressor / antitoxin RelB